MRIVSDYFDYYDPVQRYAGASKDIYFRNAGYHNGYVPVKGNDYEYTKEKVRDKNNDSISTIKFPFPRSYYDIFKGYTPYIVGFCGKIYFRFVKMKGNRKDKLGYILDQSTIDTHKIENASIVDYPEKQMDSSDASNLNNYITTIKTSDRFVDLFYDLNTPIYVATEGRRDVYNIDITPSLKNLNFDDVFDMNSAYQEIQMFLNNNLRKMDDPNQVTDNVVLRDSKGFDNMSFKKGPTKKR